MKTLKFRAWIHVADDYDVRENKFPIYEMIYQDGHNIASFFNEVCDYAESDIIDIMQFTGLYDKNGNEIYEKDIILRKKSNRDARTIVSWDYNELTIVDPLKMVFEICFKDTVDELESEVVGNIYENPELV